MRGIQDLVHVASSVARTGPASRDIDGGDPGVVTLARNTIIEYWVDPGLAKARSFRSCL